MPARRAWGRGAAVALYHLSVKPVSRGAGRSAVAAAAYRTAEPLHDARQGVTHDYTRKRGVEARLLLMPYGGGVASFEGAGCTAERERLWNAAEAAEKRKDARVAREYELALPCELDAVGRRRLVTAFAGELVRRHGVAVDAAVHAPGREGDQRNWHAHVLATTRRAEAGALGEKAGIELSDTARAKLGLGKAADEIEELRALWGGLVNRALAQARAVERVDHRSYTRQGRGALAPMQHAGPAVSGMERKAERRRAQARLEQSQAGQGRPQEAARAVPVLVEAFGPAQAAQDGPGAPRTAPERATALRAVDSPLSGQDGPVRPAAGVFGAGAEAATRVGQRNAAIQAHNRAVEAARRAAAQAQRVLEQLERAARRDMGAGARAGHAGGSGAAGPRGARARGRAAAPGARAGRTGAAGASAGCRAGAGGGRAGAAGGAGAAASGRAGEDGGRPLAAAGRAGEARTAEGARRARPGDVECWLGLTQRLRREVQSSGIALG